MRVLFDTNVLFSAFVANGLCADVIEESLDTCEIIWSEGLKREFVRTLKKRNLADSKTLHTVEEFSELCLFCKPSPLAPPVCRDPDDDLVLATALVGKVQMIVTGDKDLLVLQSFRGIRILTPRDFLEGLSRR